jgi:hypothetical protein
MEGRRSSCCLGQTQYVKEGMAVLGSVIRNIQSIVNNGVGHELLCNAEMKGTTWIKREHRVLKRLP